MEEVELFIDTIMTSNKASVVAIIVDIEGSSYRKEGAWMLFIEDEAPLGMISGGCLENDLHNHAKKLFHTGKTELLSYDLSAEDDLGWGRGAGCNGIVHILLRDVDEQFKKSLKPVQDSLLKKEPVLMIQSMEEFNHYTFSTERKDDVGFWDRENDSEWLNTKPFQKVVGQRQFGTHKYFIQLIWPKPDLYIFGAGIDARPLVNIARDAGFTVHVVDWREKLCQKKYFAKANTIRLMTKNSLLKDIQLLPIDIVVIMTHDFEIDQQLVNELQQKVLLYFGILGTPKRSERLAKNGTKTPIRTPVGLPIGADGPVEIAVSIVAELIAVIRGKAR